MTRPLPRRRALAVAGALLLAGPALTGCSAHPGRAAEASYVLPDGTRESVTVSENELQTATTELARVQGLTAEAALTNLIWLPAYEKAGADAGVTVTDDDARKALASVGIDAGSVSRASTDVVRAILYSNALSSLDQDTLSRLTTEFQDMQASASITVSPRYDTRRDFIDTIGSSAVKVG